MIASCYEDLCPFVLDCPELLSLCTTHQATNKSTNQILVSIDRKHHDVGFRACQTQINCVTLDKELHLSEPVSLTGH